MNKDIKFSEESWIKSNVNENFFACQFSSIRNFFIFWNSFEKIVCDEKANFTTINTKIERLNIESENIELNRLFSYFQSRYTSNNRINDIFEELYFRSGDQEWKDITRNTLESSEGVATNMLLSILFIALRLRNNLFHGVKDLTLDDEWLMDQNLLFSNVNKTLALTIDLFMVRRIGIR